MANFTFTSDKEVFNAKQSLAYPASNAQNSGQLNSEENIRWIMLRLTKRSFTLTEQDFKLYYDGNVNPSILKIASGTANIDGYYFRCDEITDIELNDFFNADEKATLMSQIQIANEVLMYVKFKKNVDAADHLLTYTEDTATQTISKFLGFTITLTTDVPTADELYLGTVKIKVKNSRLYVSEVKSNPYKCMFINSTSIYADEDNLGNQDRTLYNLIKYVVQQTFNTGIGDLTLYGNEDTTDGTTNIFLSNRNKRDNPSSNECFLRLYYNATSRKGGLALIDQLHKIKNPSITNSYDIFTFDFTSTIKPQMKIHINSFTIGDNGITLDDGNVGIGKNLTVGGEYYSEKGGINLAAGNITTNGIVRAEKVYGAVWS